MAGQSHATLDRSGLVHLAVHLVTPVLMCLGMGLAYLGAFHSPQAHDVPVALIGQGSRTAVAAQALAGQSDGQLKVSTVPSRAAAVAQVKDRTLVAAYLPQSASSTPTVHRSELIVAGANSDTAKIAAQQVFGDIAVRQGTVMSTTDVVPTAKGDGSAQSLFFLLVMLSIGSYGSVAVIGAAAGGLRLRVRAAIAGAVALVVSGLGALLAGPVFHLVDHDLAGVWAMALVYSLAVVSIGVGLHAFLKRWTTLIVMALFVMLNFTSAGGVFPPYLQNGFFGALHSFWIGSGFVEGVRNLLYFDGTVGIARQLATLLIWLAAGVLALCAAGLAERAARRRAEGAARRESAAVTEALEAGRREGRDTAMVDVAAVAQAAARAAASPGGAAARTPYSRSGEEEMEETVGV
ncbi:hypothetical protein BIV57_18310 [Mangrovactinospora gilvigrisea]|uniref:DUF3533 domain-containing protein n=1 Tax=Mangrovactinospora gilvigrisea TaxID=1428644 RepID=A0A1J7BBU1_9ACTN|nr:hypothetical protein [Mangrovactinospora gilvigrisea]OIV36061.1 hypothetical protein BIV57_18310 [Mangrovactinospora gilvigrisea]